MSLYLAWTTVGTREDAERLARGAVDARLAACVQIEGPVESWYRWEGRTESAREFRLAFKCLPEQLAGLRDWVHAGHPYEVPEWIVVQAEAVSEKYLSWARENSTPAPFHSSPPFT